MKSLLERILVQRQFLRQAKESEIVGAAQMRLNFSAHRAEVRAAGCCRATPAALRWCYACLWRVHKLRISPPRNRESEDCRCSVCCISLLGTISLGPKATG